MNVPAVVRNKALAAGAARWLDELPGLIASLERDWQITVGRPFPDATEAFVAEARPASVLKLMIPRPGDHARNEITVLRLAGGDGCVRLLRADPDRGALLLERLGRPLHRLGLPLARRHEILCATAARVWRPGPGCGLPTGADKGRWLAGYIAATWADLGRPCSERAVEHALGCAARRVAAHDDERAVLVHGDVHQWNVLEAGPALEGGAFKLVDPDGLLAEAEYDLGVLMREDPVELRHGDPGVRARWLARCTGLDATAIWEWGVAERVSTGLLCTSIGLQPVGREMLATADYLAQHPEYKTLSRRLLALLRPSLGHRLDSFQGGAHAVEVKPQPRAAGHRPAESVRQRVGQLEGLGHVGAACGGLEPVPPGIDDGAAWPADREGELPARLARHHRTGCPVDRSPPVPPYMPAEAHPSPRPASAVQPLRLEGLGAVLPDPGEQRTRDGVYLLLPIVAPVAYLAGLVVTIRLVGGAHGVSQWWFLAVTLAGFAAAAIAAAGPGLALRRLRPRGPALHLAAVAAGVAAATMAVAAVAIVIAVVGLCLWARQFAGHQDPSVPGIYLALVAAAAAVTTVSAARGTRAALAEP